MHPVGFAPKGLRRQKRSRSGHRNRSGFTLIELLIVVAIIGLVATVMTVSVSGALARARDARRKADLRQIGTAIQVYYTDIGTYPLSNGWCTQISNPSYPSEFANAIAAYLPKVPYDPLYKGTYQDYFYYHVNTTTSYVYAELEGSDMADDGFSGCARIGGQKIMSMITAIRRFSYSRSGSHS